MFNKKDILLIIILLVVALSSLAYSFYILDQDQPQRGTVVVKISNEIIDELPLEEDGITEYEGEYGLFSVERKDSQVRMRKADCPDQLCVLQGWLDNTTSTIICLPNEAVIDIQGEQELDGVSR